MFLVICLLLLHSFASLLINDLSASVLTFRLDDDNNPFFQESTAIPAGDVSPVFGDLDGDGDKELLIGNVAGGLNLFNYSGLNVRVSFVEGTQSSTNFINIGSTAAPTLGDMDGDGKLDLLIGGADGALFYYRNISTTTIISYFLLTGNNNPFNNVTVSFNAAPALIDIDKDGDLDLFIGEVGGIIRFYRNEGSSTQAQFVEITGNDNPLGFIDLIGNNPKLAFIDIDADGDADLFVGESNNLLSEFGKLHYYKNTGSAQNAQYTEQTDADNPVTFNLERFKPSPTFFDFDDDGDFDLYVGSVGSSDAEFDYFENRGTSDNPLFMHNTEARSPTKFFKSIRVAANFAAPAFVDIDGDGDHDAFVGQRNNTAANVLIYYENQGDVNNPSFIRMDGQSNPLTLNGNDIKPAFVDIDKDGDFDAFIGNRSGTILHYENTGNVNNPVFSIRTGGLNPLTGIDIGFKSSPAFIDIDNDGDFDAFIGVGGDAFPTGTIRFYRNTGTAQAPQFVEKTGIDNPLDFNVGGEASPAFIDIDRDGDFDVFIGSRSSGPIAFFLNTGTDQAPQFERLTGDNNPYSDLQISRDTAPAFVDIDNDGFTEAFVGEIFGEIHFFDVIVKSTPTAVNDTFETTLNFPVTIDVLNNDSADLGTLFVSAITRNPLHGTVSVNTDNSLTYTPENDFAGLDFFDYRIEDDQLGLSEARVNINVIAIAVKDFAITLESLPVTVDILSNDLTSQGALTLVSVANPDNGVIVINTDKTITYTSNVRFIGMDRVSYFIRTDEGLDAKAEVEIIVGLRRYADWVDRNFNIYTDAADQTPDADPDNDGVPNLIEFATKTSPEVPNRSNPGLIFGLEFLVDSEDHLQLTFNRLWRNNTIKYIPEYSEDAINWTSGDDLFEEVSANLIQATLEQVIVRLKEKIQSGNRQFIRLRIEESNE